MHRIVGVPGTLPVPTYRVHTTYGYTVPTYRIPMGTLYPPMDPAQQVACVGDR